MENSYSYILL